MTGCTMGQPKPWDKREAATEWWREDFDGHTYIIRGGLSEGQGSGITHDPDCRCYQIVNSSSNQ